MENNSVEYVILESKFYCHIFLGIYISILNDLKQKVTKILKLLRFKDYIIYIFQIIRCISFPHCWDTSLSPEYTPQYSPSKRLEALEPMLKNIDSVNRIVESYNKKSILERFNLQTEKGGLVSFY